MQNWGSDLYWNGLLVRWFNLRRFSFSQEFSRESETAYQPPQSPPSDWLSRVAPRREEGCCGLVRWLALYEPYLKALNVDKTYLVVKGMVKFSMTKYSSKMSQMKVSICKNVLSCILRIIGLKVKMSDAGNFEKNKQPQLYICKGPKCKYFLNF